MKFTQIFCYIVLGLTARTESFSLLFLFSLANIWGISELSLTSKYEERVTRQEVMVSTQEGDFQLPILTFPFRLKMVSLFNCIV